VNVLFNPASAFREALGTTSPNLIQLALRREPALNVEYLARAVIALCAVVDQQQHQIQSLQQECADARTDLRRACARGRSLE